MSSSRDLLIDAEEKALLLFTEVEKRGLLVAGKLESALNGQVFELADELFGIEKYWHKRIVRSGKNTLLPYQENPEDLYLQEDDILFMDFGPIFESWEADLGRTFVIGNDPLKLKLKNDVETAWHECHSYFASNPSMSGADLYHFVIAKTTELGWEFGGEMAGHIIGQFPHERLDRENKELYIHPENTLSLQTPDKDGNKREWILEIHFVDRTKEIGGFFEQLLR